MSVRILNNQNVDVTSEKQCFDLLYVDCPWNYSRQSGRGCINNGSGVLRYDLIDDDGLRSYLKDNSLDEKISENAICLFWVTLPRFNEQIDIMESWGFKYVGPFLIWLKKNKKNHDTCFFGAGSYTAANIEILVLGMKKYDGRSINGFVYHHPIMGHSMKPCIHGIITDYFNIPDTSRKVELFSRRCDPKLSNWFFVGNQIDIYKDLNYTDFKDVIHDTGSSLHYSGQIVQNKRKRARTENKNKKSHSMFNDTDILSKGTSLMFVYPNSCECLDILNTTIWNNNSILVFKLNFKHYKRQYEILNSNGFKVKTIAFFVFDENDEHYFEIYMFAVNKKTKIRELKNKHISQCINITCNKYPVHFIIYEKLKEVFKHDVISNMKAII